MKHFKRDWEPRVDRFPMCICGHWKHKHDLVSPNKCQGCSCPTFKLHGNYTWLEGERMVKEDYETRRKEKEENKPITNGKVADITLRFSNEL